MDDGLSPNEIAPLARIQIAPITANEVKVMMDGAQKRGDGSPTFADLPLAQRSVVTKRGCPICRVHPLSRVTTQTYHGPTAAYVIGGRQDTQYVHRHVHHCCTNCGVTVEKISPEVLEALQQV